MTWRFRYAETHLCEFVDTRNRTVYVYIAPATTHAFAHAYNCRVDIVAHMTIATFTPFGGAGAVMLDLIERDLTTREETFVAVAQS